MDYALLGKCSPEVPWDGSDFSTWHQSSTLINFRLFSSRPCTELHAHFKVLIFFISKLTQTLHWFERVLVFPLMKGQAQNIWKTTPCKIQHFCSYFTFSWHHLYILMLGLQRPKFCGLCSWHTMKTPNADNNSCLLPRQYIILFNKNSQWVLSWFLFLFNFIVLYFYHTIIYFGIFSSSNHFAYWSL